MKTILLNKFDTESEIYDIIKEVLNKNSIDALYSEDKAKLILVLCKDLPEPAVNRIHKYCNNLIKLLEQDELYEKCGNIFYLKKYLDKSVYFYYLR
jgi:hypothetical protein